MTDVIGPRAQPIMSHMNKDHEDSMVAIVCQRVLSLPRPPRTARMTSIDANGFTLEYKVVKSLFFNPGGERRTVRVPFQPAVKDSSEVRQRIVDLAQEAQQKRRKRYLIAYSPPRDLPLWIFLNLAMLFVARPDVFASVSSRSPVSLSFLNPILDAARARLPNGAASMRWFYAWLLRAHAAEAAMMAVYSYSRGARGLVWIKWILTHFTIGFTTFASFKKLNPSVDSASSKSH